MTAAPYVLPDDERGDFVVYDRAGSELARRPTYREAAKLAIHMEYQDAEHPLAGVPCRAVRRPARG